MYDYVIVGGGISGLYMYMKLLKITKNICILEQNNYFGGRIKQHNESIQGKQISFPEGASRFNRNHTKVIELCKQFNLFDENTSKVSSQIQFIDTENEFPQKFDNHHGFMYINKVISESKQISKESLQSKTFQELAAKILKKTRIRFYVESEWI